jgi:hypothetical protein
VCDLAFGEKRDRDWDQGVGVSSNEAIQEGATKSLDCRSRPRKPSFWDTKYSILV